MTVNFELKMDSNSSEDSCVSEYSTESSDEDGMEVAQINGAKLLLPQGLCDKEDVFKEFFSPNLWNSLSNENKTHLKAFLPKFPENDEEEKNITLERLFKFEKFKFNSPLQQFHENLKAGYFRPDIARMRNMIRKAEHKEAKYRYKNHKELLKNSVLESRRNLLNQLRNLPPGSEPKVNKVDLTNSDIIRHRTKRRYFQILSSIRAKTEEVCSSDENYLETTVSISRKQKRFLNGIKNSLPNTSEQKFFCSFTGTSSINDLERYITPNTNPFYINEDAYRNILRKHKKRKQEDTENPEFNTRSITLQEVIQRTQLPYLKIVKVPPSKISASDQRPPSRKKIKRDSSYFNHVRNIHPPVTSNSENESDSDSVIDAVSVQQVKQIKTESTSIKTPRVPPIKSVKVEVKKEPEEMTVVPVSQEVVTSSSSVINSISNFSQYGKIMPVTLSDLEGIDMMNLPIDLDNSEIDLLDMNNKPELMQETHSNFLSLIRDIICSTPEHRMDFQVLEKRLQTWQESPISPLNDWYPLCESWVGVLKSAVNFLCGNTSDVPNDFVPYLEYKQQIDAYQWIGAGRDSDSLLAPLCKFWLEHRDDSSTVKVKEEIEVELSDRAQTPPPPRCPTNWTIRKATQEEVERFQEQEKRRYENPHKAFTYCCNGYESVVAPLKGIYNPAVGNAKARGHSILTADRPNFVTILSLVRDATARLPNGEGTRGDIVELLKQSQYISAMATDSVLQTVVSGALDRMHTQFDPCVKYDTKRKIWIYLHRNRSEEDFEKIHHLQSATKTPKKPPRRSPAKPKVKQTNDKVKQSKENNSLSLESITEKIKISKKPIQTNTVALSSPSLSSSKSNSLLISNNIHQREPSPPTIQILENIPASPSQSQEDPEISQALQAIVDGHIPSPKLNKSKAMVRILSPSQSKSLISPSASVIKQEKMLSKQANEQIVTQQLIQMSGNQKQTIQVIQTQSTDDDKKSKLLTTSQPQQILQNVTAQQLQNIKNITLLRNNSPIQNIDLSSTILTSTSSDSNEVKSITVTVSKPTSLTEQMVQPGIQIKTPNNLTPAQQQQILQTIKQKILPQTVIASQQQQLLLKQKLVQKQGQSTAPGISLLGPAKMSTDTTTSKSGMVSNQTPVVAKVLTNAAGQVISVENLLAHQKQHGSLPQGTTLRVSGTKGGQPNIIHLTGTSKQNTIAQFAVASQSNLIALTTQPKLVVASPTTSTVTSTITSNKSNNRERIRGTQLTKLPPKVTQQLINAKIIQNIEGQKVVQPKLIVGQGAQLKLTSSGKNVSIQKPTLNIGANSNAIRMVNTANLNLTHIGGKPVLFASKGATIQNIQGQNVILQTQPGSSGPSLVLQNSKTFQSSTVPKSSNNINIINQQNVVLGSQVKMQQPQVVFKNNAMNQVTQSHIVLGGQPVRLHTSTTPTTQRLVLASQGQGGQIVAQQILLPAGFQGTAINIKALQGVKVIPIAQAHSQNRNLQGRQVFARVVSPTINTKTQQSTNTNEKQEESNSQDEV
ncbi:nuclear factor related to kappa-B-binding protein isoform X2 [Coccinella septempunctata]|uniref:nuclear factor related to kappa-B-binding protein isoform X2 n=1 Tax=Coccinella septempunctata TaxID=41139 RepID=UPI001D0620AB|nr:nuclear factor related to kappa-B-binding protein isoform X2 [Coccinella septempunctata]